MARRKRRSLGAADARARIGGGLRADLQAQARAQREPRRPLLRGRLDALAVAGRARGRPAPAARRRGARGHRPVTRAELAAPRRRARAAARRFRAALRQALVGLPRQVPLRDRSGAARADRRGARRARRRGAPAPDRLAGPELGAVPLAAAACAGDRHPVPDRAQGDQGLRHRGSHRGRLRGGRARARDRGRRHHRRRADRGHRGAARRRIWSSRRALCVLDREEGGNEALAALGVRLEPLFRRADLGMPVA